MCGPCPCVWPGLVYVAVCAHTPVYGVCISVWLELVCVRLPIFCVHIPLCLWWPHRCVVGFVCLWTCVCRSW